MKAALSSWCSKEPTHTETTIRGFKTVSSFNCVNKQRQLKAKIKACRIVTATYYSPQASSKLTIILYRHVQKPLAA